MKRKWARFLALFLLTFYGIALLTPFSMIYAEPPQINAPEVNPPEVKPPDVNPPEVNEPEVNSPDVKEPASEKPEGQGEQSNNDNGSGEGQGNQSNDPGLWQPLKYVLKDIVLGQVDLADVANDMLEQENVNVDGYLGKKVGYGFFATKILRGGVGLAVPSNSGWKTTLDAWTGVDNTLNVVGQVKDAKKIKLAKELADAGDFTAINQIKPLTGLGKFSAWGG